ncbi:hypothetical protein RJ639_015372 [Escallonia herrerae]|uniref:Peptidase A1 domain-containing protein n=1 Tax=Escallonia herrerae TaxID=1293975 RepID=A0AA88VGE8_9ASTE|nr:hypothetical protein RJ639_015372 [Escallonia herrerae]
MEIASLLVHHAVFLPLVLAFLLSTTTITNSASTAMAAKKAPRMATRLIHRDSILSPFYNASATISDRATQAIQRDKARLAYLKASTTGYSLDDIRSGLVPNEFGTVFYANISIGQPPVPQLVVMDTGSSLFWIQCPPCYGSCGSADNPTAMFDPSKSSSYSPYPCPCDGLGSCDGYQCQYSIAYGGGTSCIGLYAREDLTFVTKDEKPTTISNVLFGCSHEIELLNGKTRGILGLGPRETSVTKQLGSKFSYCIGNISDPEDTDSQLIIGNDARIEGNLTQLDVFGEFYYLTLQGIVFGDKQLNIDPQIFQRSPSGDGGVIIDSGMTITVLAGGAFDPLRDAVQSFIDGLKLERVWTHGLPLCYKGIVSQNLVDFPIVTFQFANEADLVLGADNLFLPMPDGSFCLAIKRANGNNSPRGASVIGVVMQQYVNVGYDLSARTLSFMFLHCAFLYS